MRRADGRGRRAAGEEDEDAYGPRKTDRAARAWTAGEGATAVGAGRAGLVYRPSPAI